MNKENLFYFKTTILVVLIGILSRKIHFIPLFVGDILYAIMVYFGLRFIFKANLKLTLLLSLLFCFIIEFSQLITWEWLTAIRRTNLGHYVLGEGFLWADIACYILGCTFAFVIDRYRLKN